MPIAPEDLLVLDAAAPLPDFEPEAPAPEAVPVALTDPVAEDVAEASYVRKKISVVERDEDVRLLQLRSLQGKDPWTGRSCS